MIDWSQFLPTLIATCIGCMLAFFLTGKYDQKKARNEETDVLKNVISELKRIEQELKRIDSKEDAETYFYLAPLHTPAYDSLVYTRKLGLVLDANWIRRANFPEDSDNTFQLLYEYIKEYNAWHNWRTTNSIMLNADQKFADEHIAELKDKILSRIDALLREYEKEN